jgi:Mg2+/Co2+ transporter CorB
MLIAAGVQAGIVVDRQGRVEGLISIADISEQLTTGPAPSPSPAPEPAGATS